MDDNTPIANFLNSFVDEGKARQDQATAVTKIFIDQWLTTLGDCKKFTAEDLKGYEPTIRKPLRGTYRGYEILTMPPPSSGGVALLEMLNMLEHFNVAELGPNSSDAIHLMTEIERRAFADRAAYMGDTDFVNVPITGLLSRDYAANLANGIKPDRATPSAEIREGNPVPYESPETTHFTIADAEGNVVSNTYTLNNSFGCGATPRGSTCRTRSPTPST